jgi:hypothetical protein
VRPFFGMRPGHMGWPCGHGLHCLCAGPPLLAPGHQRGLWNHGLTAITARPFGGYSPGFVGSAWDPRASPYRQIPCARPVAAGFYGKRVDHGLGLSPSPFRPQIHIQPNINNICAI